MKKQVNNLFFLYAILYIYVYFFKQIKNPQLAIFAYTIFAVKVLNFSVRYGKRCIHFAIVTNKSIIP